MRGSISTLNLDGGTSRLGARRFVQTEARTDIVAATVAFNRAFGYEVFVQGHLSEPPCRVQNTYILMKNLTSKISGISSKWDFDFGALTRNPKPLFGRHALLALGKADIHRATRLDHATVFCVLAIRNDKHCRDYVCTYVCMHEVYVCMCVCVCVCVCVCMYI